MCLQPFSLAQPRMFCPQVPEKLAAVSEHGAQNLETY